MPKKKIITLAVIPARSGSKGIKNKNLRKIKGKSLIGYAADIAIKSKLFDFIAMSSDSIKYKKEIESYKNNIDFVIRNKKLSSDKANSLDVWRDTIKQIEIKYKIKIDVSMLIEPTNPLRKVSDMKKLFNLYKNNKYDGCLTISKKPESFTDQKTLIIENNKLNYYLIDGKKFTIRQDIPVQYYRNGIGYISNKNYIFKCRNDFLYGKIGYLIINRININIDSHNDLKVAKLLMEDDSKNKK